MVYPNLQPSDLAKRSLEVTAWNYQPDRPNEFLGEVVLDLSGKYTGGQHTLMAMHPFILSGYFAVIFSKLSLFHHCYISAYPCRTESDGRGAAMVPAAGA